MKPLARALLGAAVGLAAVAAVAFKPAKPPSEAAVLRQNSPGAPAAQEPRPRLLDLGAGKCIPCKAMKPILEELMADYHHLFDTQFMDVWLDPDQGRAHDVHIIPTQIFFDEKGEELWRHEGFMSKEDIFKTWQALGYDFAPSADET